MRQKEQRCDGKLGQWGAWRASAERYSNYHWEAGYPEDWELTHGIGTVKVVSDLVKSCFRIGGVKLWSICF